MRFIGLLPPLLLLPLAASPAAVEEVVPPVIVTATRTAQTADETLASVTVITREEIERRQSDSVQDVLRGVPGLAIANNGGPGKVTSVFLRGTESDHVLVLIDGIEVGSATLGTTAFQDIPIDQIERIEIVRGPRSSLYGSEAIGGVIQIFTRKGGGPLTPSFSLGGGSYQTLRSSAGVSGGGARGWYSLRLAGIDTEGFNACRGTLSAGCFTVEPDDDGYRNTSGSLRAGYRFANGVEVDLHALRAQGRNEFDGSFVNESDFVQQVVGGSVGLSPLGGWHATLRLGRSNDELDNFLDGTFQTRFDTERDSVSFQNDIAIGENHLATLGLDYQDDRIDSTEAFAVTSRDNKAVFAQHQATFGAQDLRAAVRLDDNEQFGSETTGSVAWGYDLGAGLRFTVSYGTAFKAPSFNELFFPGFGNPDLEPERSKSVEASLRGRHGWGDWSLNVYQTDIDDLIAFDAATFAPVNVDSSRIRGLEAVASVPIVGWDLSATLTLLDAENRGAGANRGNELPRRAPEALRIDLDRVAGKLRFGATLFAEGSRFDDLANTRRLGGYATVDLRAEYALARDWRLQARVANLLDKDYETAAFFNQAGRNFFVTLRYQPAKR